MLPDPPSPARAKSPLDVATVLPDRSMQEKREPSPLPWVAPLAWPSGKRVVLDHDTLRRSLWSSTAERLGLPWGDEGPVPVLICANKDCPLHLIRWVGLGSAAGFQGNTAQDWARDAVGAGIESID